jgi:hypothetical protein
MYLNRSDQLPVNHLPLRKEEQKEDEPQHKRW